MSEVFQVSTNNIIPTRQANIDGVIYTVRRKGSGDDLDISIRSSKLAKIGRESISDRNRLSQAKTDEERAEITEKLEKAMMKVAELQDEIEKVLANLFDDGGDGSKSKAMVHKYGADGVKQILDQIFGDKANATTNE